MDDRIRRLQDELAAAEQKAEEALAKAADLRSKLAAAREPGIAAANAAMFSDDPGDYKRWLVDQADDVKGRRPAR